MVVENYFVCVHALSYVYIMCTCDWHPSYTLYLICDLPIAIGGRDVKNRL